MAIEFRWNDWNLEHGTRHGCTVEEIESVLRNAGHGWPRKSGQGRYVVEGRSRGGRIIRVGYVVDADNTRFVIRAMPLTTRRRRRRR